MRRCLFLLLTTVVCVLLPAAPAAAELPDPPGAPTWEATSLVSSVGVADIAFGDAQHGCFCTDTTGYYTVDAGATWNEQLAMGGLLELDFGDVDHAWGCGPNGRIAASSDGGATWTEQASGFDVDITSIDFIDASNGWALTRLGDVLGTKDGGVTWARIGGCAANEGHLAITFVDTLHGWAGSGVSGVSATSDGGVTWRRQDYPAYEGLYAIDFADAQHGWLAGGDGVYRTENGGTDWVQAGLPAGWTWWGQATDVVAADSQRVWAITNGGDPLVSPDGGITWYVQAVDWHGADFWLAGYCLSVIGDEGWAVRNQGYGYDQRVVAHTTRSGYGDPASPVTTITPDTLPAFTRDPISCSLLATDSGSGVAATYYCLRQGAYAPAVWQTGTAFTTPMTDGEWFVDYCSEDVYGNIEQVHEQRIVVDTTAPTTIFTPRTEYELDYWINFSSSVTIDATEPWPGSGLGATMVSLDSAPYVDWVRNTAVVTAAPRDHSNDGRHRIRAYTSDALGNVEAVKTHIVGIDTRKPACKLPYPLSCVTRGYLTMKFRVNDTRPCYPSCLIEVRVKTLGGSLVGQVLPGKWFAKNKLVSYRFRVPLRPGTYRLLLRANDGAGNISAWKWGKLTVRKKTSSSSATASLDAVAKAGTPAGRWGAGIVAASGVRRQRATVD